MALQRLSADDAELAVLTYKDGVLAAAGHDLRLKASSLRVDVDQDAPSQVHVEVDLDKLVVETAMSHGAPAATLSPHDRAKIEATLRDEVLDTRAHPHARFRSTDIRPLTPPQQGFRVEGLLTLNGRERKLSFDCERMGDQLVAHIPIHQPDFGIKPYSAMFGALKVKPDVEVVVSVRIPVR